MFRPMRPTLAVAALVLLLAAAGCSGRDSRTFDFETLNGSGVTGTVTLTDLGGSRTRVEIDVDPAGHPDMPAHIHPGHCGHVTPQPAFPLENVVDGVSSTEIPAVFHELVEGEVAVNLHRSNEDLETFTACATLD